jgi:molybdate transport system substrate-binding protein
LATEPIGTQSSIRPTTLTLKAADCTSMHCLGMIAAMPGVKATRSLPVFLIAMALGALLLQACAGTTRSPASSAPLRVFAAASLTKVFPRIDPHARYQFAGSDVLQAQIQQGAPADVFASASPKQAQALLEAGLVEKPVSFATNTLALIVPLANPARVHSVYDLRRRGVSLVIGDSTVPVGAYSRQVLAALGLTSLLSHVKSNDSDVKQVVSQVALGQADAGFAYITDVRAASGRVRAIQIPERGRPRVQYEIAVVKAGNAARARAFVDEVLSSGGQAQLRAAGFGPP